MRIRCLSAVLMVCALTTTSNAEYIINGSFEDTPVNMENAAFITLYDGDDVLLPGWIVKSPLPNDGLTHDINLVHEDWEAAHGLLSLDLNGENGPGGIAQIFSTTPGHVYEVSFMMAGNPDVYFPVKTLRVVAAGQSQEFSFDNTGRSPTDMGWEQRVWSFTAMASTTELWFHQVFPTYAEGSGAGTFGSALDNVRVFDCGAAVVPEPSTLVALGGLLGMGSVAGWWKRRRRAA